MEELRSGDGKPLVAHNHIITAKGQKCMLPMGTAVKGFVDEDVPLAIAAQAVAPIAVFAPTPKAPPPAPYET